MRPSRSRKPLCAEFRRSFLEQLEERTLLAVLPLPDPLAAAAPEGPPSDLTGNGAVDFQDLTILLANWNKPGATRAQGNLVLTDETSVDFQDLTVLLAGWTGADGSPTVIGARLSNDTGSDDERRDSHSNATFTSPAGNGGAFLLGCRDGLTAR